MAVGNLRSALIASVAIYAAAMPAQTQAQTRTFNVPAQRALTGIPEFARQADIQILVSESATRDRSTRAVRGRMSVGDGLRRLLAGTGLRVSSSDGRTFTLTGAAGTTAPGEAAAGSAAADDGSADGAGVAEILVVGSRSQNVDIARTEDDPQPYVVLGREEIERSGAANLDDFLRTRLPMNYQPNGLNDTQVTQSTPGGSVNLRGIGTNQTLVLVDGRRQPGISLGGEFSQPNITGIPLSAIERIEVLPATAGAIYGGSAVGGVVNVVLKRNYGGIDLEAGYGNTFDGATGDYRVSLNGGWSRSGTSISVRASRSVTGNLQLGERAELIAAGRDLLLANNPAAALSASGTIAFTGTQPNICSARLSGILGLCNGVNLVLDDGTPLNASFTSVPAGYAGPQAAGDGGHALLANAGRLSTVPGPRGTVMRGNEIDAVGVNVRQNLTNWLTAYADISYDRNRADYETALNFSTAFLAASDPANPFRQDIAVYYPLLAVAIRQMSDNETVRVNGGLIVRLPRGFSLSLEQSWSRSSYSLSSLGGLLTTFRTDGAKAGTRDITLYPPLVEPFFASELGTARTSAFELLDTTVRAGGPIVRLPAGPLNLTLLLERRSERLDDVVARNVTATAISYTMNPRRNQRVDSGYVEANIPLFSETNGRQGLRDLSLQLSLRYDRYRTRGTSTTLSLTSLDQTRPTVPYFTNVVDSADYLIALHYSPVRDIAFRASYSTGFLPPAPTQLQATSSLVAPNQLNATDTRLGGVPLVGDANGQVERISGGNPDLEPERSRSWSAGVILTPRFLPGFRASIDYTNIQKRNEITTLNNQQLIDLEDELGRIRRGPGATPGVPGPIIGIDGTFINADRTRLEAIDVQIDYAIETAGAGTFHPYLIGTRTLRLERDPRAGLSLGNSVGFRNGPLAWRGNIGVDWTLGGLTIGWNAQYYDSYFVYLTTTPLTGAAGRTQLVTNQGSARISSQFYNDLYARYRFNERHGLLSGIEIFAGIQNVFNRRPPVVADNSIFTYAQFGDPRLRRFTLSIRKHFGR